MIVFNRKKLLFNLTDILGLLILAGILLSPGGPAVIDPGLGWHLATGKWIDSYHSIPSHQLFLLPDIAPSSWIDDQWLSDLVFFKLYQFGTLYFLHIVIIGFLSWVMLFPLRHRFSQTINSPFVTIILLFIITLLFSIQWIVRPVVVSFFLFSITYLHIAKQDTLLKDPLTQELHWKSLIAMTLMFALWANMHPGFVLGLFLLGTNAIFASMKAIIYAIKPNFIFTKSLPLSYSYGDTARFKQPICIFFLATLATCVNPYGLDLHRSIFSLVNNAYFTNLNSEWQSPNILEPGFRMLITIAAAIIVLAAFGHHKILTMKEVFLVSVFVFAGLISLRFLPFLAIVISLPLAKSINKLFAASPCSDSIQRFSKLVTVSSPPYLSCVMWTILICYALQKGTLPTPSGIDSQTLADKEAREILQLVKDLPNGTRIFNSPNFGGLIAWNRWPNLLGFIDDRNQLVDEVHYKAFMDIKAGRQNWLKLINQYRFTALLIEPSYPLRWLIADNWSCNTSKSGFRLCKTILK